MPQGKPPSCLDGLFGIVLPALSTLRLPRPLVQSRIHPADEALIADVCLRGMTTKDAAKRHGYASRKSAGNRLRTLGCKTEGKGLG